MAVPIRKPDGRLRLPDFNALAPRATDSVSITLDAALQLEERITQIDVDYLRVPGHPVTLDDSPASLLASSW